MIEALYAGITVIAMGSSRRPIDTAILTILNAKTMSLDWNSKYFGLFHVSSLNERRDEGNDRQLLLLKIRKNFGQDARIDFPKHDHRYLHSYIEGYADTKKRIERRQLM